MLNETSVVTIFGTRGSGKTTVSRSLQKIYSRVIIFDRLREYRKKGEPESTIFVQSFDDFSQKIKENFDKNKFRIIMEFSLDADAEEFNEACNLVYHTGNCLLVIEEIHHFASPHMLPKKLKELYLTGRHQNIALIATTQRPAELHKTVISQSHFIFAGRVFEPNDIRYLSGFMYEASKQLQKIEKFNFLIYSDGEILKKIKIKE